MFLNRILSVWVMGETCFHYPVYLAAELSFYATVCQLLV